MKIDLLPIDINTVLKLINFKIKHLVDNEAQVTYLIHLSDKILEQINED